MPIFHKKIAALNETLRRTHVFIHSSAFRKTVLLSLVIITLLFDLAIMRASQKIGSDSNLNIPQKITNPWEAKVREIVKGSPMEKMAPYISSRDKKTAAFLVSVAKKESNLGKFSPRLNGQDCYNYWGFRSKKGITTPSGYTCFSSPRQAVKEVSKRISQLVYESKLDTPKKMVVWKCGYSCSWDNPEAVKKWIRDVDYYYQKFYE